MLRRLLPLSVVAAAAVLTPGVASAAPVSVPTPMTVTGSESYQAFSTVRLSDGTTMNVILEKNRSSGAVAWQADIDLWSDTVCADNGSRCTSTSGSAQIPAGQASFGPALDSASVRGVPVTLTTWTGAVSTQRTVAVSALFTGTGPTTSQLDESTACMEDDSNTCLSGRYEVTRAAVAVLSVGQDSGSGDATLFHGFGVDATPRSVA